MSRRRASLVHTSLTLFSAPCAEPSTSIAISHSPGTSSMLAIGTHPSATALRLKVVVARTGTLGYVLHSAEPQLLAHITSKRNIVPYCIVVINCPRDTLSFNFTVITALCISSSCIFPIMSLPPSRLCRWSQPSATVVSSSRLAPHISSSRYIHSFILHDIYVPAA